MNKLSKNAVLVLCFLGCLLCAAAAAQEAKTSGAKQINPIWTTVVQHIEESTGPGGNFDQFLDDRDIYLKHRQGVVELANKIKELGYAYNFQSDWTFLAAVKKYDDDDATVTKNTNGKNLVRWLKEDMGFEIDPHAHESAYNYADVAYLIEQLGVKPSAVAGGFLYAPLTQTAQPWWDRLRQPINGWKYPDYTWKCDILWGGATMLHAGVEEQFVSGIWRPKSREEYTVHDPNGNLVSHGHWTKADDVITLVHMMEEGELQPVDGMFTGAVFSGHPTIVPGSPEQKRLFDELEKLLPYTKEGKIRWAGLTKQVEIWKTQYGGKPTFFRRHVVAETKISGTQKAKGKTSGPSKRH